LRPPPIAIAAANAAAASQDAVQDLVQDVVDDFTGLIALSATTWRWQSGKFYTPAWRSAAQNAYRYQRSRRRL
jgi:hypothetical protein